MKKQYYSKIEIRILTNNQYYVVCCHFFHKTPFLLKDLISLAKKLWAVRRNICENVHYWKKQENSWRKTCKMIFSGTIKKYIYIYAHDTIQCLENVLHYLNMKMPGILVEIIDLQICSSLKWDSL